LQTGFVEAKDMQLTTGSEHLNRDTVIKTYARWAPIYDKVFGSVFEEARRAAVAACEQIGGRVLEVGVGTGISLPYYSSNCHVTGIDISEEMLEVARQRVADDGLQHVERLELMDAEHLAFADGSFDVVVAQYVVNTVPNPEAALDEFLRVLRPGGELVIVNRVGAEKGPRRAFEVLFQPFAQRLGWRSKFEWERFENWAEHTVSAYLVERRPVPPLGHFSLIRFGKSAAVLRAGKQRLGRSFQKSADTNEDQKMQTFFKELATQRWDDHRYYHHSRINQSLHLVSAISFLVAYGLLLIDPPMAALLAWLVGMTTRQAGHFFFEPKGYDHVNEATQEYKEDVKVGYNLRRKVVLMGIWALFPALLLLEPALFGLITPHSDWTGFARNLGMIWLGLGVIGVLFRMAQLFVIKDMQAGLVWVTKILTDPFHDVKLYYKAPLSLLRGELIDPTIASERAP
jgi:ubiquinone/menaquinone biosynthesis C-methylase UbiE